jgi:hypothetical protein
MLMVLSVDNSMTLQMALKQNTFIKFLDILLGTETDKVILSIMLS